MYIPLNVPKWTVSSILKTMEKYYTKTLNEIIKSDNLSIEEKNKRIDHALSQFLSIRNAIIERGLKVKKENIINLI